MDRDKSEVIFNIVTMLLEDNEAAAKTLICEEYPHTYFEIEKRTYTMTQKMNQFIRDGFIDRYTGEKLLNPGILKIISFYFPNEFPYHPHWKLYPKGDIADWDGLTSIFLKLVDKNRELLKDSYIKSWYNISRKCLYNKDYN